MTVLSAPVVWKKPRPATETRRSSDLTPEEQANARKAIRFLAIRLGGQAKLAKAMRATRATINLATSKRGKPSAGLALRAARVAGVGVEELLAGRWPVEGACPHCGRD
jgi:hypothetical protein